MFKKVIYISNLFLVLGIMLLCLINRRKYLLCWNISRLKRVNLDLLFLLDKISITFFSTLCIIVSCVLKFSVIYMNRDLFPDRFHWLVYRFVFSMFCMIFIPHFFFLLVGWDGLGITSFLLVIYYVSNSSWGAGLKTYLINRIGDGLFLVALAFLLIEGHWDIKGIYKKEMFLGFTIVLILGSFTKRAQFPFSSWLPAAMAAPTPVSALVHSSTLVTAGVYLLIRFHYILPKWIFLILGVVGLWTLYSARLAACVEWDGKKIVAYSTLRQLGFMIVALSLNLKNFAFFHLITHALFKAMMFICVGYFMINKGHFQDLRSLSGMWKCSPFVGIRLIISRLSLMGIPFFSGFFSKEFIIENKMFIQNEVFHYLLLLSLPLTSFYICRLMFQLFCGVGYLYSRKKDLNIKKMSIIPLFLGRICAGKLLEGEFLSVHKIYPCSLGKILVITLIIIGIYLAWIKITIKNNTFRWFFSEIGFISPFKGRFWINYLTDLGDEYYSLLDQGKFTNIISRRNINLMKVGNFINKSSHYFLKPRVGFYVGRILIIMIRGALLI